MCSAGIVFLVHAGVDWMWEETAVGVLGSEPWQSARLGQVTAGGAEANDGLALVEASLQLR